MRFSHVLIVTYGRTGSTLLQGVLNSIDGCLVRGENFQFCRGLFLAWDALQRAKKEYGSPEDSGDPSRPWFGAAEFDAGRFFDDARRLVMNQLAPLPNAYRCIGFKEIRYLETDREPGHPLTDRRLREYLWFLVRLFRNPAIILLRREHEDVVHSAWWSNMEPERVRARLEAFEQSCGRFASNYRHAFAIDYADVVGHSHQLEALFEFLGAPYDPERVAEVLAREHSSRTQRPPGDPDAEEEDATAAGLPG